MLYDLIVARAPANYLDDHVGRVLAARLEMLRQADGVLAISQAVADEAVDLLGLTAERVHVIGGAAIVTTGPNPDPLATARSNVPGLREGFVLAPLGSDSRKNSARLLRAFARLPAAVRSAHQLMVTGLALDVPEARELSREAARLDIANDVILPGIVPSALLDALYRSCALVVFPSLDEGFGLPVAEGLAHGAAVIAADIPSIREIVPQPDARFDPDTDDRSRGLRASATPCGPRDSTRCAVAPPPWPRSTPGSVWPTGRSKRGTGRSTPARRATAARDRPALPSPPASRWCLRWRRTARGWHATASCSARRWPTACPPCSLGRTGTAIAPVPVPWRQC